MNGDLVALIGFLALFALMLLRVPVGMAMGLVGVAGFGYLSGSGPALKIVGHTSMRTVTDWNFAVVPLFLLMGSFATTSGMSRELFRAANAFLGHLRGGLGIATIAACGGAKDSPSEPTTPTGPTTPSVPSTPSSGVALNDDFSGRNLFPFDNWWNQDISRAPLDGQSNAFIDYIGRIRTLHPDFGPPPYGIPYVGVGGSQTRMPITFVDYGSESDAGFRGENGYPIPTEARTQANYIEGGVPGGGTNGDRHLIVVDRDRWVLFELFATRWNNGRWEAGSGAVFDLSSNARRPEGWTSADAAGLAILPGLARYEEAASGREIRHAFRVTVRATNGYVWPASHRAGSSSGALPMGARLRLKASKNIASYPAYIQRIFRAMQTYGLIVADNGSDMYISGAMDSRWNNDELNPAFRSLTAGDFEVVQLGFR